MPNLHQRRDDRPIAAPPPAPVSVDSFLMLLDGELTVARSIDHASRLYECRRDDAVTRIGHYFERAKISPLTPMRRALGLSSNQMVVPRLETTRDQMLASFMDGDVPNLTAFQWLTNSSPSELPRPDDPASPASQVSSELEQGDSTAATARRYRAARRG